MTTRQLKNISVVLVVLALPSLPCPAQKRRAAACSRTTFAAFRRLPELRYECGQKLNESDEAVLKVPQRITALAKLASELELFTDAAWWQAGVEDLNACEMHGEAGALDAEEKASLARGDYAISLFGNHAIRLILVTDPCYQTGYNGSVAFLLFREGGRVFATQVLDGNYSRVDNSVGFDFANFNGQTIIEVSTSNSMPPLVTNYYYVIDPKTHRAAPKELFRSGGTLTNQISSAMILGEPTELGLPRNAQDMRLIKRNRLLPNFSVYAETFASDGPKLKRTVYRWSGRVYQAPKLQK
ncbi:MAG TPA: hypothetical protein VGN90_17225 [Pyrinomonadaceae bacterium]|jgi:hypothetical protein|nr:hypothetical protein [Pyrinomonadaceae bacterium]